MTMCANPFPSSKMLRTATCFTVLFLALCQLARAQASVPQDLDLSTASETRVEVIDVSNLAVPGNTYVAATLMNGSVQKLCSVIMNYSEYPEFMPNTDKTTIVSTSEGATVIEMTLGLPLGKIKRYRLKMMPAVTPEYCQLSWKLVPWEGLRASETIVDTAGYWQLSPYPKDKNKTLVKYYVFADPGPIPYGLGWIVDVMTRISLPRTLEALRERVAVK